ncbi:hypothetical protein J3E69DRAFT_352205 [Trichoderma sp. SZMC 28015]
MRPIAAYCLFLSVARSAIAGLHDTADTIDDDDVADMYKNYHGWVNPEDLTAMPQCIAQQDHDTWLEAMTKCTQKRCTSQFGVICTHHQWLTELSCLSIEFSPDVLREYLPYCSRSILAKAQLYHWTRNITGRSWFVDVGDANGLTNLWPSSLPKGYAGIGALNHAPTCLTTSQSASSNEKFQYSVASCVFTATPQHIGNAERPWEYSQSLKSMTALDFVTAGYSLARGYLPSGEYFDKDCFCNVFTLDFEQEPCSASALDMTKERLWLNSTCGSVSLPDNWTNDLKTTGFAYMPIEHWKWPTCVTDMPNKVTNLVDQCATDACEISSPGGYCNVKRAVERSCLCHDISYDSCGGSCRVFEGRIDYLHWLHDLCGSVEGWHGLPSNWRQLTNPSRLEMIPWRWSLKPDSETEQTTQTCASNEWKFGSITLVNMGPLLLSTILINAKAFRRIVRRPILQSWLSVAFCTASLQLFANLLITLLVVSVPGYENVPFTGLMMLWGTMPRVSWLTTIFPSVVKPSRSISLSEISSVLLGEVLLQCLSAPYMLLTIKYGLEHNLYFRSLESTEGGNSAKIMYNGALLWLISSLVLLWAIHTTFNMLTNSNQVAPNVTDELTPLISHRSTLSNDYKSKAYYPFSIAVSSQFLIWLSQCFFWVGFISLSSKQYVFIQLPFQTMRLSIHLRFCPPLLQVLTGIWVACSAASAAMWIPSEIWTKIEQDAKVSWL